jgi:uncharacterized membrane protein
MVDAQRSIPMMYYGGWNPAWAIVCMVAIVAIIALVAWAIVSMTRRTDAGEKQETPRDDAITTLQHRFASGEIDEQEYTRRRDVLAHR